MNLPAWITRLLAPKDPPGKTPKEPPDPDTLPQSQWNEATKARARLGLKPWPNRPDTDYFNMVNGTCRVCGIPIYGCQAIEYGPEGIRCGDCFTQPVPSEGPGDHPPRCIPPHVG